MTSWCPKINMTSSSEITKTCRTRHTNHDRDKLKIELDIIVKPVKQVILNVLHKVKEIPAHFIYEIKTTAYDVN